MKLRPKICSAYFWASPKTAAGQGAALTRETSDAGGQGSQRRAPAPRHGKTCVAYSPTSIRSVEERQAMSGVQDRGFVGERGGSSDVNSSRRSRPPMVVDGWTLVKAGLR